MHYVQTGSTIRVLSEDDVVVNSTLDVATYILKIDPHDNFYLSKTESLETPGKIYGDQTKRVDRILNTFSLKDTNVGVLLIGTKGCGKTHLTKMLSEKSNMPTIIVNMKFDQAEFLPFIRSINTPCVIIFDEFEKLYSKYNSSQQILLTLLDGVYSSRHLFLFTANDAANIDDLYINRPSRIFYRFDYSGLDEDFIREYCSDRIDNKSYIDEVVRISTMFNNFNFDMMQAIVEESNRYKETPLECLNYINVNPTYDKMEYDVEVVETGSMKSVSNKNFGPSKTAYMNPMNDSYNYWVTCGDDEFDISVSNTDIANFDISTGIFTYVEKDGYIVKLTPVVQTVYNYKMTFGL